MRSGMRSEMGGSLKPIWSEREQKKSLNIFNGLYIVIKKIK